MRRLGRWLALALVGFIVAFAALILFSPSIPLTSDAVRQRVIARLAYALDSDVTLDGLQWRLFPTLRAEGQGLTIKKHGSRADAPPLIYVAGFSVDASPTRLARHHVGKVTVWGLDIEIDRRGSQRATVDSSSAAGKKPDAGPRAEGGQQTSAQTYRDVVIDELKTTNGRLVIIPAKSGHTPRAWVIHALSMHKVSALAAMPFDATLTNAIPPGEIKTAGSFGPWNREDPGATAIDGAFTFARADLGIFHGIQGTLSAHGRYTGSLGELDVKGQTETPDFTIDVGGHPFGLSTTYHAVVDATNGDTRLEQIDATFLSSTLTAHGAVLDTPEAHGRTVKLDITMPKARVEDVMTMAVKTARPPMTGGLRLSTKFVLPPGETDVVDRIKLDGDFSIARARFTQLNVQSKINELSQRSRGLKAAEGHESVVSNFQGRFNLAGGRLTLPRLTFDIPGATVKLAGMYGLRHETLDFRGNLLMDAKVSQTQTGWKALLLKVVDPLFRSGGRSDIPIHINGTRNDPQFGLDFGRVFKRGD